MKQKQQRWSSDELILAFDLYCRLPFGRMHHRNKDVVQLAELLGRTPGSVAMKLVNFASLDPSITGSGRRGLSNVSTADRDVWKAFNSNWDRLSSLARMLREKLGDKEDSVVIEATQDYSGEVTPRLIQQRVKQTFFRQMIVSSYANTCCISGVSNAKLLVASHIVPWAFDKSNRLNPRNGLCLSALHDKAFDRGLITVTTDYKVKVSGELRSKAVDRFTADVLGSLDGTAIRLPEKFRPDAAFLEWHQSNRFLGE